MENRLIFDSHPSEDVLEQYVFDRLSEQDCADFEEHLLVCPRCQDHLTKTDEYVRLFKRAASQWGTAARPRTSNSLVWRSSLAAIVATGAVTAALAIAIPHRSARATGPTTAVELVALRGGGPAIARARPGAPISIAIDTTDLDDRHNLRIEVVDAAGNQVWSGTAGELGAGNRISARISAQLAAGVYWIRLYSAQAALLREFGLRVE